MALPTQESVTNGLLQTDNLEPHQQSSTVGYGESWGCIMQPAVNGVCTVVRHKHQAKGVLCLVLQGQLRNPPSNVSALGSEPSATAELRACCAPLPSPTDLLLIKVPFGFSFPL